MLALAIVLWALVIEHVPAAYGNTPKRYPILAACTRLEYRIFNDVDFLDEDNPINYPEVLTRGDLSDWISTYHATVGGILASEVGPANPMCTGGGFSKPGGKLRSLAEKLPSWRIRTWDLPIKGDPPRDLDENIANYSSSNLTKAHVGVVLLEYLRMYECALVERGIFLPLEVLQQEQSRRKRLEEIRSDKEGELTETESSISDVETQLSQETDPDVIEDLLGRLSHLTITLDDLNGILDAINSFLKSPIDWLRLIRIYSAERRTTVKELVLARRSLHRSLAFATAFNRLRTIDGNIRCIQQGTLDIRNGFAIAADASSCLPRIWNVKDALRDYKTSQ